MLSSIKRFIASLFSRPAPAHASELTHASLRAATYVVTRHPEDMAQLARFPIAVATVVEESDTSDDDDTGSPKIGCWLPPRVGQSWPERLATLRRRAAAVGLTRVGPDMYAINGIRSVIRVDETDRHMLFPGEQPSRHPEFHGRRYMTDAEMANIMSRDIE